MFLALTSDQDIVLVLALFFDAVFQCCHAVSKFLVIEPLALVLESV